MEQDDAEQCQLLMDRDTWDGWDMSAPSKEDLTAVDPGTRQVIDVDPIEGDHGVIDVAVVYRHKTDSARFDCHAFRFQYTAFEDGYSLGLDEWHPPEQMIAAHDVTMLRYLDSFFDAGGIDVSMSTQPWKEQFEEDADITVK